MENYVQLSGFAYMPTVLKFWPEISVEISFFDFSSVHNERTRGDAE